MHAGQPSRDQPPGIVGQLLCILVHRLTHIRGAALRPVARTDFPCVAAGKTLDEARGMAVEALSLHFRGMVEGGEAIPEASTSTLWQTIPPWGVRSHFW